MNRSYSAPQWPHFCASAASAATVVVLEPLFAAPAPAPRPGTEAGVWRPSCARKSETRSMTL